MATAHNGMSGGSKEKGGDFPCVLPREGSQGWDFPLMGSLSGSLTTGTVSMGGRKPCLEHTCKEQASNPTVLRCPRLSDPSRQHYWHSLLISPCRVVQMRENRLH